MKKKRITLALDQSVGWKRKQKLITMGYDIVVVANHAETDESWLNRAFVAGAMFAISPDLDIPRAIENNQYPMFWINYPSDRPEMKDDMIGFIDRSVKHKMRTCKQFAIEPKPKKNVFESFIDILKGA